MYTLTSSLGWLLDRRTRAFLAWAAVLIAVVSYGDFAWTCYDDPSRPEGTTGHVFIDFGGQWLMGRMLVRGEGPYLYHLDRLDAALHDRAYQPLDADTLYGWLAKSRDHPNVGGALYPPIAALYDYPLGLLPPLIAYRVAQGINLLLTFAIGFLIYALTRGRIWAAVGAGAVIAMPGYNGALALAQNAPLSLTILMLGWLLVARGRPWLGGMVWGLLAFKPVWAAAFFLAPLRSGRWRVCTAMLLTGIALALATLPFVGWRAWFEWLEVGRTATVEYRSFENWIYLSRDLQGLPRRWLSFAGGLSTNADEPLLNLLGTVLWLSVPVLTVVVAVWRRRQLAQTEGTAAAFLLLGAFLSCYHFMYYDMLLAVLPLCVLFAEPTRFLRPVYLVPTILTALFIVLPHLADGLDWLTNHGRANMRWPPWDTFCLLGLWVWCGIFGRRKDEFI